jgi:hypothetical protein
MKNSVMYKGMRFDVQTVGRYYQCTNLSGGDRLLHRRVWEDTHGRKIPKGYIVHHRDKNWRNNRPSNLELLPSKAHFSAHMKSNWKNPKLRPILIRNFEKARQAAIKWHGSPDGAKWHSEHSKRLWKTRKPKQAECSVCGGAYQTYFKKRSTFCSKKCSQKESYLRYKTAKGVCPRCGDSFVYNKFRSQTYCSRACSVTGTVRGFCKS